MRAILALEDGTYFEGKAFGAAGEASGEAVFNTSMSGYQEILTDPSYAGQIISMTYPHIGNYGVNDEDNEAVRPFARGLAVRELSRVYSNHRAEGSLSDFLERNNVIGVQGIDTRALTRHIRDKGAMRAVISTIDGDPGSVAAKAAASPGLVGIDLVKQVTCSAPYQFGAGAGDPSFAGALGFGGAAADTSDEPPADPPKHLKDARFKVVAFDFGMKGNILRCLEKVGCAGLVVPATTTAEEVLAESPDGVFLSNGPGDPAAVGYAIETIRELLGKVPVFGICLGHQLLSLAIGAQTYKLKFGHRGGNQPVQDMATDKVEITSQNHGFAVDAESLPERGVFGRVEVSHLNLNDRTVEGLRCLDVPAFSVQYHPEASPGPHDSFYLFERFTNMMEEHKGTRPFGSTGGTD